MPARVNAMASISGEEYLLGEPIIVHFAHTNSIIAESQAVNRQITRDNGSPFVHDAQMGRCSQHR
jgi:hypothetical protein